MQRAPEVGVKSVEADKYYAAETEGHDNTDLLFLKESLEVVACLKAVNEDGKGNCLLLTALI